MVRIGLGTTNTLSSRVIRKVTGGRYSHAWLEFYSGSSVGWLVLHSTAFRVGRRRVFGVTVVPRVAVYREFKNRRVFECAADQDLAYGVRWALSRLGVGYDFGVIWNGLLLALFSVTGWNWLRKKVVRNAARFSCSEIVAEILKRSGVKGSEILDPELTTVSGETEGYVSLEQFCVESPELVEL